MNDSRDATGNKTRPVEEAQESSSGFRADLPLAVLESVRQHDRPSEVLEDEDLAASLPRRLGLTGVVDTQIRRYELARKRREQIPTEEVGDLFKLVLRRPDSEPILREAGHGLARHHARKPVYRLAGLARLLPETVSARIAKRSIRGLIRRVGGGTPLRVTRRPFQVEIQDPITARVDKYGVACMLYSAAIEEGYLQATGRRPHVEHSACQSRGDDRCIWEVQ